MKRFAICILLGVGSYLCASGTYAAVGRTPGHFSVTSTGSAQYSIPIWAPPGPRGVQPQISLVYNSTSGNGILGVGWSLAGLGSITRCNKTYAQDGGGSAVALATSDGYCLNGSRLRVTSGLSTYGQPSSTYQTEIADFSNITASSTSQGNGPSYWIVKGRNGLTYYYGYVDGTVGANSQVIASGSSPSTALTWLLSKVVDRAGNSMIIDYSAGTSTAVPQTIYWTPASAGSSSYNYQMNFTYTTNNPQTSVSGYVAGSQISNVNLLTDVTVTYMGTTIKKYVLSYQRTSPTTGRNELTQVQECADSGATNCLSPTTISYQDGTLGISGSPNTAVSDSGSSANYVTKYDFNGDGFTDIAYYNGSTWYVTFGSASGFGTPVNTGITDATALFGNLQGTGKDEILAKNGSYWYYYVWGTTSFTGASTELPSDKAYVLADVNGDGLPDLVYCTVTPSGTDGTIQISTRYNTSTAASVRFSSTLNNAYTTGANVSEGALIPPDQWNVGPLRTWDFNGDGYADLALWYESNSSPVRVTMVQLFSNGDGTFTPYVLGTNTSLLFPIFFNWNDDACTDYIWNQVVVLSGCNGSTSGGYGVPEGTIIGVADYNGDGRSDILVALNNNSIGVYESTGTTNLSGLVTTPIPYNSSCNSANCFFFTFDANGDGLDDFATVSLTSPYPITYYLHNGTGVQPDLATSFVDGYGNSASPTYVSIVRGNYTEHGYGDGTFPDEDYIGPLYVVSKATFSDPSGAPGTTYNQTFSYYGAWTNLQGRGFDGFGEISILDSRNSLYEYHYYERAFPYTGMRYQDIVSTGSTNLAQDTSTPADKVLDSTANNERYFAYFSAKTQNRWEVGGSENGDLITTINTSFTYDNYGNATQIVRGVYDEDPGSPYKGYSWTTTVTNTTDISANPSEDLAAWCLNMLDLTQVTYTSTLSGSTAVTRTKQFTPDTPSACRIKTIVTEPTIDDGFYAVTEGLAFDAFGNVQTDTVTGAYVVAPTPASRVSKFNWGTTGQFMNSETDPSGATTSWVYSSDQSLGFGVPDSVKDPNGLVTSWGYDGFGRKQAELHPDGTSNKWTWTECASHCGWSNSIYQVAQTVYQENGTTTIRTDTNYYDPIDRVTETSGPNVSGTITTVQRTYNSLGLLYQQSMPFLSGGTVYEQTDAYDLLNRLTSVTRPISSTNSNPQSTTYQYAGRKTIAQDPYGHATTTITDVNGWLRQTQDPVGYYIKRTFDAAGSLTGITDSVGNTLLANVTYAYGIKPFRLTATDADLGAATWEYDSLGELYTWTDANGNRFNMTYDALSRPATRTEPDLFTQWNYGTAAPNWGRLTSECTQTVSPCSASSYLYYESRSYDSLARLQYRSIAQNGNPGNDTNPATGASGVYLFTFGYSPTTGLLVGLTYPKSTSGPGNPLNLDYGYGYGLLQTVTDTSDTTATCGTTCVLWTANAMNAFGQVTQETLGNGVVTNRSYDAVTSWLTRATGGVGGGAALLNQSYLRDEDGNITQRQDNNAGLTESFVYDADNRLTCIALSSTCTGNSLVYDGGSAGPGNVTYQVYVGTYDYPTAGSSRPHGVTAVHGNFLGVNSSVFPFSYDANGNMTSRASTGQNIYWYTSNYPSSITSTDPSGTEEVQFNYGPDRQRWEQIYTGPGGTETTYYVGGGTGTAPGLLDVVFNGGTTTYRQYIYAGSEPIAVYSRSGSTDTMNYMLEDHQGGIADFVSSGGVTDVGESFTAFGQRRNPTTWATLASTQDRNTIAGLSRQGYTFQTWLGQSMGLNHMNGRVQDAVLGRFLSADRHIPDPTNAQSYNRYTYVNNNPLTNGDPTGFALVKCNEGCFPDNEGSTGWSGGSLASFSVVWGVDATGGFGVDYGDGSTISNLYQQAFEGANAGSGSGNSGSSSNSGNGIASSSNGVTNGTAPATASDSNQSSNNASAQSLSGDSVAGGGQSQASTQSALPCPDPCLNPVTVTAAAYNGYFHDAVQGWLAQQLTEFAVGGMVFTNVKVCTNGVCATPDILYRQKSTGFLIMTEVKTGLDSKFSDEQLAIYAAIAEGGTVTAATPALTGIGINQGSPLPPTFGFVYYVENPFSTPNTYSFNSIPWWLRQ